MAVSKSCATCVVLFFIAGSADLYSQRTIDIPVGVTQVRSQPQNWSDNEADKFYHASQGSQLLPRNWLIHLEQPGVSARFLDPVFMQSFGYITRSQPSQENPESLPVGFSYEGRYVGMTCAACHTALMQHKDVSWLIDGAPSQANLENFLKTLAKALEETATDDAKFARFAKEIVGDDVSQSEKLRTEVKFWSLERLGYNTRNLSPKELMEFGPGRIDAFGAILNEATSNFLGEPSNQKPANAPVSFPFLWDAPQHDRVQWNGVAVNEQKPLLELLVGTKHVGALGRNIGEVLGVFGTIDAHDEGSPLQFKGYPSSANKQSLVWIEDTLRALWSPEWPDAFGKPVPSLVSRGESLYRDNCLHCHAIIHRSDPNRVVEAKLWDVGTDRKHFENFGQDAKTKFLQGRMVEFNPLKRFGPKAPRGLVLKHLVQRALLFRDNALPLGFDSTGAMDFIQRNAPDLSNTIAAIIPLGDNQRVSGLFSSFDFSNIDKSQIVELVTSKGEKVLGDIKSIEQVLLPNLIDKMQKGVSQRTLPAAYKARPLNGIWATAPYLHNGSVLTLDELLRPAALRKVSFRLGSNVFDSSNVGFEDKGPFEFKTDSVGNSNAGHDHTIKYEEDRTVYRNVFTEDERKAIIEFLKTL